MTTIKVGSFTFDIMFESHRESYTNSFESIQERKVTHPTLERWGGGQIEPFTIEITLVAGVTRGSPAPQTGSDIVRIGEGLMGLAVQREGGRLSAGPVLLPTTTIQIGTWYKRVCVIERCDFEGKSPWDSGGRPMRAVVTMTCRPSGLVHVPQRNKYKFNA